MTETVRLTVAQALVRFLANQYSERDGAQQRLVTGMFGIFGRADGAQFDAAFPYLKSPIPGAT